MANFITLSGLFLSLVSCFFAIQKNIQMSITLLIASSICDLFDGVVARKIEQTKVEKRFGIYLDTVVDIVSFGITPAIIVFSTAGGVWYKVLIYCFYVICAAIRLAYFNTTANPDKPTEYYQGLPVTCIALILPIVLLFHSGLASIITLVIVGTFYILNIKMPKLGGIWYVLFPVMAVILIILWWCL